MPGLPADGIQYAPAHALIKLGASALKVSLFFKPILLHCINKALHLIHLDIRIQPMPEVSDVLTGPKSIEHGRGLALNIGQRAV